MQPHDGSIARNIERDRETIRRADEAILADDIPRAMEIARAALDDGLRHPMLFNLRSHWYEQQGRNEEALTDIKEAMAMAPNHFTVQNAAGVMFAKLGQIREAVDAFRKASELAPDYAPAHFNLGWSSEGIGQIEEAEQSFRRAVELVPNHAHAMAYLADLAYRRGDLDEAARWADRSIALEPNRHLAIATRARLAIVKGDLAAAEAVLDHIPDETRMPPVERTLLSGIRGELLHEQGRHAEAFAAHTIANNGKLKFFAHYDKPGRENTSSHLAWLIDYFRTAAPQHWRANRDAEPAPFENEDGAERHIFLVGFPRSGTTLLENILASHPKVVALEEKELMQDAFRRFMTDINGRLRLADGRPEDLEEHRKIYWRRVRDLGADVRGKTFIDKHPLASMRLMLVSKLFPHAKVLFAIRDPRDVVLSCFRRSFMMNFSMFEFLTLERAAVFYDRVMLLSLIEHEKLGLDWYYLRHEALVGDFEAEVRKVCAFIGLDWSHEMNDFALLARSRRIATPSSLQVLRGLNKEGVGIWRNYKEQLAPIMPILNRWVKHYGYPSD